MGAVTESELFLDLERLRAETDDPRAGVFGPGTVVWEVAREAIIFLGAGRAALLQLAHPYVGVAVGEHSVTRSDPLARFRTTFRRIFRMVFGDLDEAIQAARGVYAVHSRIRGIIGERAGGLEAAHAYDARDRAAKIWVLATLWDTSLWLFERLVRPLSDAEKARYYAENRRFGRLFGVADSLPPSYPAFCDYVREMLAGPTLEVTRPAAEIGRFIMNPQNAFGRLVSPDYRLFTAQLLPARLAAGFGLEQGGAAGARRFQQILRAARAATPLLPARIRYLPAYIEATRRLEGRSGRDRVGELLSRLYVGQAR
ncbi:MAG: DUF2236 domain-containing protein [Myxococcales bacterium]|nr:DUF2236 domain-containing protein [Myxococcales bacterium]